jgi:hypothetical protein
VSLASGGHHDNGGGDAGGDGVAHGDGAAHGDGVAHGHSDTPGNHDGDAAIGPGDGGLGAFGTAMGFFLSLQLWTYLLAFGGITGLLLRAVAKLPEPLTGLCAAGVGLGTALAARAILRRATGAVDSGTTATDKLAGATAKVLIPAAAGQTGKIRLESRGQTVDLLAHATDGAALIRRGRSPDRGSARRHRGSLDDGGRRRQPCSARQCRRNLGKYNGSLRAKGNNRYAECSFRNRRKSGRGR